MQLLSLVRLRTIVDAERRSLEGALLVLVALVALPVLCLMAHRLGQRCTALDLPLFPAVVGMTLLWGLSGLPRQLTSQCDRRWNRFVYQMPVGRLSMLLMHGWSGVLPILFGAAVLVSGLAGAGVEWDGTGAIARWMAVLVAVPWVLAAEVLLVAGCCRFRWWTPTATLGLLAWSAVLVVRVGRGAGISEMLAADPVVWLSGVGAFARCVSALGGCGVEQALLTGAHLGSVAAGCALGAALLMGRAPQERPARRWQAAMSGVPARAMRHLPGEWGAQFSTECLRLLRSTSGYVSTYAVGSLLAMAGLRAFAAEGELLLLVPLLAPLMMVGDGIPEIMRTRRGSGAYELVGADHRRYTLAFVAWGGLSIGLIPVLSLVFLAPDLSGSEIVLLATAVLAVSVTLVPPAVALDERMRRTRWSSPTVLLRLAVVAAGLMMLPLLLLWVGTRLLAAPLVIAAAVAVLYAGRINRATVRRVHWRLGDDRD